MSLVSLWSAASTYSSQRPPRLNEAVQGAYERLGSVLIASLSSTVTFETPAVSASSNPTPASRSSPIIYVLGTNVLVVPTGLDFHFRYGDNSAEHHRVEADRLGVACSMVTDSPWRFDVDEPGDVNDSVDSIRGGLSTPSTDTLFRKRVLVTPSLQQRFVPEPSWRRGASWRPSSQRTLLRGLLRSRTLLRGLLRSRTLLGRSLLRSGLLLGRSLLGGCLLLGWGLLGRSLLLRGWCHFPSLGLNVESNWDSGAPSGVPTVSHRIDISCTRPCATQSHDCTATDRSARPSRGRAFFTALHATRGTT